MAQQLTADVAIAGAGTTGAYLAWRLAQAGFGCAVIEQQPLEALGTDIGPFHMEDSAFDTFHIPRPEGDELLHSISDMTMYSPSQTASFSFQLPTLVMDKPRFIRRLHGYAVDAGARLCERTGVTALVREGGMLVGLAAEGEDGPLAVRAKLVIDATGIAGAVRGMIPAGGWLENDTIRDDDSLFVYMETWRDVQGELRPGVSSYPDVQGWCAPGPGDTRIVGIGSAGGVETARRRHRGFVARLPYTGEVVDSTTGRVPYRRSPWSLVDNGFATVGDAAFMNKPFSGEGVTSAFAACDIFVDVASSALAADDLTRDALWPYNARYFRGQGAKFAFLTATLPALMGVRQSDMEAFFDAELMSERGSLAMQQRYELEQDPRATLRALPVLAEAIARGELSLRSLGHVGAAALTAARLKRLYERYPQHAADFGCWVRDAQPLWHRADEVRRRYFHAVAKESAP